MSDLRCRAMTHRPVQMHSLHTAMQPVEKVLMTVKAKESLPLLVRVPVIIMSRGRGTGEDDSWKLGG